MARPDLPDSFSLTEGGPFHHVLKRLHLQKPRHWYVALIVWLPLVFAEALRVARGVPVDPMMWDLSVHVRFLIALPLLLSAESVLHASSLSAITSMYKGQFCDRELLDRIVGKAERSRDWWLVEALILGVALTGGQLVLWQVFGPSGVFHGVDTAGTWTAARVWYAVVALPVFQFVLIRWLWRWLIWCIVLVRISRLPLTPLATHPDFAGGLVCLARPTSGLSGFVLATSSVLASAWGTQVLAGRVTLDELLPGLAAFLLLATTLATAPLVPFCGHLFRNRRRTLSQYGDFARGYVLQFHAKWIGGRTKASPLGSPDIQSLEDLGGAYRTIAKSRIFVFGPRNVFQIWFSGILPMVPLFASTLTVEQILKRIVTTVLGGMPF